MGQVVFDSIGAHTPGDVKALFVSCGSLSATETTSIGGLAAAFSPNKQKASVQLTDSVNNKAYALFNAVSVVQSKDAYSY